MTPTSAEEKIVALVRDTSSSLPADVARALKAARRREARGGAAAAVLKTICDNCALARRHSRSLLLPGRER